MADVNDGINIVAKTSPEYSLEQDLTYVQMQKVVLSLQNVKQQIYFLKNAFFPLLFIAVKLLNLDVS